MEKITLLLLIFGFLHVTYAAAVFQFPDLTRRLPGRTTTPGCTYKGERYAHGEPVGTNEPCLNCTCIRAVVVCYLRVCPSASSPPPGCFLAREIGQCCPTLVCGRDDKPKSSESSSGPDLRPTFQPEPEKVETTTPTPATTISEENSLMFVSSTRPDDDIPFLNDIPGGCLVNGTLYGDGSAMLSSSFCEYCFCIRGKTTCLRPKCDLFIEGCSAHYDSHFSCCPSRYDCYQKTTVIDVNEAASTVSTTTFGTTKYPDDYGTCVMDGHVYHQGEVVPDYRKCHNCYCSDASIICDIIKCSPALDGCQPIVPEGHCCPVSYKCDHQEDTGNYNITVVKTNGSSSEMDLKRTEIKTVKQSELFKNNHAPNPDARPKNPILINDLTTFFNNFVPVHRRLDKDVAELYHSPEENFNSSGIISGHSTDTLVAIGQSITPPLRENDKTLNLEAVESTQKTTPVFTQTKDDSKNVTYHTSVSPETTAAVSVGAPEVQLIPIRELFKQIFAHDKDGDNVQSAIKYTLELKRNNSKQPSSIVDFQDSETTLSDIYNSNEVKSAVNTNMPSLITRDEFQSTTPGLQENTTFPDFTGSVMTATSVTNQNFDSTLIHTTLYFAEEEDLSRNDGSTPYVITGTKNSKIYTKPKSTSTDTPNWYRTDSSSEAGVTSMKDTIQDTNTRQNTKATNRINSKLPSSYRGNATKGIMQNSNFPLMEDSLVNLYLTSEGRDVDSSDFTNIGAIHLGAPISVEATELRKDSTNLRNKITESGGVIFMDPKYTDIKPNLPTKNPSESTDINDTSSESAESYMEPIERSDIDISSYERRKGPRIQDAYNQTNQGQDYKIIPFVAEDAIRGKFGRVNNTFQVLSSSTQSVPDIVADFCFVKGRIFVNGEMIPKADPCELCRCFYGQELCQLQRCPTPPPNCVPEKLPAFCCPRFTCGNNSSFIQQSFPAQKITINTQPNSQLVPSVMNSEVVEKPKITGQKHNETKFGTRVRQRPTQNLIGVQISLSHGTTIKEDFATSTTKIAEILKTSGEKATKDQVTTISKTPEMLRNPTTKTVITRISTTKPEIIPTTKKVPTAPFSDPWGLLKVSGCNIYGKFFNINDQVEILSGPCSHCICTSSGVECNDIC